MSDKRHPDLVQQLEELIRWEQRIYGNTPLPGSGNPGTDKSAIRQDGADTDEREPEEGGEEIQAAPENSAVASTPSTPAECRTLEELEHLARSSTELKTDLEGTNPVFGVGDPAADLMIIGEAPGYHEDQQGEPFVGKAGQLLDKILQAIEFKREEVYIANILKHRPPRNRDPKPEERERSLPWLKRQIELIDPRLILCLGRVSATTLLGVEDSLGNLRSRFHPFMGRELMVTYHPAALLRNPQWKRATWQDVQMLRKRYDELRRNV